jgi:hypothetical protein
MPLKPSKTSNFPVREWLGEGERQTDLDRTLEEAQQARLQMCGYLLESALNASKLPAPLQDRLRKQFDGHAFAVNELKDAIDDARTMLSELTAPQAVHGPARISAVFDEEDKIQAAVDDLFNLPRSEKLQSLNVSQAFGNPRTVSDLDGRLRPARRVLP